MPSNAKTYWGTCFNQISIFVLFIGLDKDNNISKNQTGKVWNTYRKILYIRRMIFYEKIFRKYGKHIIY